MALISSPFIGKNVSKTIKKLQKKRKNMKMRWCNGMTSMIKGSTIVKEVAWSKNYFEDKMSTGPFQTHGHEIALVMQ